MTHLQLGEVGEDLCETIMVVLLCELDLAHVEMTDAVDLIVLVDHGGGLALCFGQG